ncbi:MAG: Holliday junction branch migration protein RuvA [Deltaproteobacteria bacterium]|nr:Holliday junction branch migration protein RuvA [Deltaproteobacteria bacterium]
MIAYINGRLIQKTAESVVIDVAGVGYECFIPLSTFYKLPDVNCAASLCIYTHLREDAIQLYGFLTSEEKEAFKLLLCVSGIGPKLARNILSGIEVGELVSAINSSDKARLSAIPGIGVKSAERMILELRDKVKTMAVNPSARFQMQDADSLATDVMSALSNLGYKSPYSDEAVKKARMAAGAGCGFEELFKESLKFLAKR